MNESPMQPRTRAKYGELAKLILRLVVAGAATSLSALSGNPDRLKGALSGLNGYSDSQIKRCLVHLRMQGYVKYDASEAKAPLVITSKGLKRLEAHSIREKFAGLLEQRWDHLWRIVAFDVPERWKNRRDQFREDLRRLNFFPFQKSIYITPYAREDEIMTLARKRGIGRFVLVSVTPNLGWRESYAISWFSDETVPE
jgi:DNA-binding transcriptional regulator PaaX